MHLIECGETVLSTRCWKQVVGKLTVIFGEEASESKLDTTDQEPEALRQK